MKLTRVDIRDYRNYRRELLVGLKIGITFGTLMSWVEFGGQIVKPDEGRGFVGCMREAC